MTVTGNPDIHPPHTGVSANPDTLTAARYTHLTRVFTQHKPLPDGTCECARPGMTVPWEQHLAALTITVYGNTAATHTQS